MDMKFLKMPFLILTLAALVITAGCADRIDDHPEAVGEADGPLRAESSTAMIESDNLTYPAYVAAPAPSRGGGDDPIYPGLVMIHSFNGLEPGYRDLADRLAASGYVVIAPEWQTFERTPLDEAVDGLVGACAAYLIDREDVNGDRLGLTGFCAGGRYTMLFLPQMEEFRSGVAWYGFPYSGGFNDETKPADLIDGLDAPMLIIHGTGDVPSPISGIYEYAAALDAAGKYFELKVYQGEGHGFMIHEGERSESFAALDAEGEMARFFDRTLKG
ncbi:dienelactone hydrolase family protein [Methanotrichaceae archaeon M04Ac]|jgi:carboxymethylenebutenolidase|uniref:Dienelactone hydrolase family protein n=2 Tax=Candidatus Methanocrinis alkalitolerans TaxID=3033395 RepID=A0ABT5XDT3_9EURY|nr:dienelactone hydrolase family protein [Candidatus Methanocrinis alkalitolerans]